MNSVSARLLLGACLAASLNLSQPAQGQDVTPSSQVRPSRTDTVDAATAEPRSEVHHMGTLLQNLLTVYTGFLCILCIVILFGVWPANGNLTEEKSSIRVLWRKGTIPRERHLFLVAGLMGLLGASTYSLWDIVAAVSASTIEAEQLLWYFAKPWIGISIAIISYSLLRGGLLITGLAGTKEINVYGMAGVIGMAGFFSKEIADKLYAMVR